MEEAGGPSRPARIALGAVLAYALLTLVAWLAAPLALPPAPLPLSRPLSAVMLATLAAVALRDRGAAERRGSRIAAAATAALAVANAAVDMAGAGAIDLEDGGPWAPYLADGRPWSSTWSAAPIAAVATAMLAARSRPRVAAWLMNIAIAVSYLSLLAWSAGASIARHVLEGVDAAPGTEVAIIALAAAASRAAGLPRSLASDPPDRRTGRRWDLLIVTAAVAPVLAVIVIGFAARTQLGIADGNVLGGIAVAASLLVAVWFYIRADRQARQQERREIAEAERQALHDPLTGLANRTLALEVLARGIARSGRSARAVTVLFCDVDGLKRVNDAFGHVVGDLLIRAVAERLERAVREEDTVARVGGDEFLVVSERLSDEREREAFADRVLAAVAEPLAIDGLSLRPGISVGVAIAEHGEDPIDVVRNADAAMYRAKADGTSRWVLFDPRMRHDFADRTRIGAELRDAVRERGIVAWFQPIVRLQDRAVVAAEALARWEHPRHGPLEAASWLGVAEEAGLMPAIGRTVVSAACARLADSTLDFVSVNLSARELGREDLADWCTEEAARWGIDPRRLAFEVGEPTLASAGSSGSEQLRRLADRGFRLIISGFGCGQDALAAWRALPVIALKLDRSVVREVEQRVATRAAATGAGIAAGLRIAGIAEGIETEEQALELRRLGWEYGQGFLLGRPAGGIS